MRKNILSGDKHITIEYRDFLMRTQLYYCTPSVFNSLYEEDIDLDWFIWNCEKEKEIKQQKKEEWNNRNKKRKEELKNSIK